MLCLTTRRTAPPALLLAALLAWSGLSHADEPDELVVTASVAPTEPDNLIGNLSRLDHARVRITAHQHVHELTNQFAGTWISRGSGQEHLTAMRSPVLTGPGACGAFLMLEDGIPSRPAGFCNVNQLFEIPSELAASAEAIRGPANALYGANGLHGTLNFLLPKPGDVPGLAGSLETGPDEFRRGLATWDGALGKTGLAVGVVADHYDGFRDDSGYAQQKAFLRGARLIAAGELTFGLTASNLDQDTAGFIFGEDSYRDERLRTENLNPEAFRKADSQRAFLALTQEDGEQRTDWRVYARRSDMDFLQHFLPGKPLEENGQVSAGLRVTAARPLGQHKLQFGAETEVADGFLQQSQIIDLGPGSSRPTGQQYDYDVTSFLAAAFAQLRWMLTDRWEATAGLRVEYVYYDYDNELSDGNLRDDGTQCAGANGCLFFRPADRSDDFFELAPEAGLLFRLTDTDSAYLNLARGFRPPQVTELYRLQSGQAVADLDAETIDSIELGWRHRGESLRLSAAGFAMRKENFIFRDADGFNVSDGKTTHVGLELQADYRAGNGVYAGIAATFADHAYDFSRDVAFGEAITDGDQVDTAPETLGSARLGFDHPRGLVEIEWVHIGEYYLNASNTEMYPGHDLLNLRAVWRLSGDWALGLRLNNVTDERYADRADFAFNNFRYLPGRAREFLIQLSYRRL